MRARIVTLLVLLWAAATFGISFGVSEWRADDSAQAEIETLREDLAEVSGKIEALDQTSRDVSTLKTDVSRLKSQQDGTTAAAASLENFATCADVALFENVVVKFVGALADVQRGGRVPTESEVRDWQRLYELDVEDCP